MEKKDRNGGKTEGRKHKRESVKEEKRKLKEV